MQTCNCFLHYSFSLYLQSVGVGNEAKEDVSQEKSKLGLGEIYAEQFLKQSASFDAKASQQEKETDLMVLHFQKVDFKCPTGAIEDACSITYSPLFSFNYFHPSPCSSMLIYCC